VLRPLQSLFPARDFPDLLIGLENPDDAAVYRLDAERALVFTNDFFTPIVDDPYDYGAIAAANSLSDVYAMGGRPLLALTIAAFPLSFPGSILGEIMRGLGEKTREAGTVIAGGHTVQDEEPKLGLCVIGMAHPDHLLTKGGLRPGDVLVLTKPLGVGIITTAAKADQANPEHLAAAVGWMKRLNRSAAEIAVQLGCRAGTDITGFGLLGHAWEMAEAANVGLRFFVNNVPFMDGVRGYAENWLFPAGAAANLEAYKQHLHFDADVPENDRMLLLDPQTSGGLLLAVPRQQRADFEARMKARGEPYWIIGEVIEGDNILVHRSAC
jgi:selenide,water dikinase